MAKTKISQDNAEFREIQAKYEAGISPKTIGIEYGVTDRQIRRYAKQGRWVNKRKQQKPKTVKPKEPPKVDVDLFKPIIQRGVERAFQKQEEEMASQMPTPSNSNQPKTREEMEEEAKRVFEAKKENARRVSIQTDEIVKAIVEQYHNKDSLGELVMSTGILALHRIRGVLVNNKQYYDGKEQQVGLQSAMNYTRIAEAFSKVAGVLGYGNQEGGLTLQIYGNNPSIKDVTTEVATAEEMDEVRRQIVAQVK